MVFQCGACSTFDAEIDSMSKSLDKNASTIVYGPGQTQPSPKMGDRLAGDAASRLLNMGFKNVMVLNGDYEAWSNAGNRVDMSEPGSVKAR